jgi:hypothetical protein
VTLRDMFVEIVRRGYTYSYRPGARSPRFAQHVVYVHKGGELVRRFREGELDDLRDSIHYWLFGTWADVETA